MEYPPPQLLVVLHYAAPITAAAFFAAAYIYDSCKSSTKTNPQHRTVFRRKFAFYASWAVTATLATQTLLYIYGGIRGPEWWSPDDEVIYALLQALLWLTLSLLLFFDNSNPYTLPFVGSWALSTASELAALTLSRFNRELYGQHQAFHVALQCTRVLCLVALMLVGASVQWSTLSRGQGLESEPLLGRPTSSNSASVDGEGQTYGCLDDESDTATGDKSDSGSDAGSNSDSDSDDEEEDLLNKKRRDLLQQNGGWISYLKQYLIFWPHIWPRRNLKFQAFFWVLAFNTLAERVLNVLLPRQFGIVIDRLYYSASTGVVPWNEIGLWLLYQILASSQSGLPALTELLDARFTRWSRLQLAVAAFDHVMGLPMSFHDSKNSGEVIKAIEQAGALNSLLRILLLESMPFLLDILVGMWYLTYLVDIYATIIVLFISILFVFVTYSVGNVMQKARRVSASKSRGESKVLYELISNWSTVAFFNRSKYERSRLADTIAASNTAGQWDTDLSIVFFGAQELCEVFGRGMISILGAYRIAMGKMSVANFVTLESYWATITLPLWILAHNYRQLSTDLVDAERLLQLFQTTSSIQDGPSTLPSPVTGKIEFSSVAFGYHASKNTIDGFTFTAEPGQTIALVGETGSGKSTILKLLMRFYDVTSGSVMIDGQDIRDLTLSSLREAFGFVPQNAALFNMSILDNVRYGRLDATDAEVHEACKAASIHDKILKFPNGYDTKVGERGVRLSGGELQRVAIARVILKNPQIVLLDEATSALDSQTEANIQRALKRLTKGRTTVMIAHRLSTVREADLILVVDEGKIVERGTHDELLQLRGKYVEHWERQTKSTSEPDKS